MDKNPHRGVVADDASPGVNAIEKIKDEIPNNTSLILPAIVQPVRLNL